MSDKVQRFLNEIRNCNTNITVFIKLFNLWSNMSVHERGKAIDICTKNGSLRMEEQEDDA